MLKNSINTAFLHYNRAKKNHNEIDIDNLNSKVFLDDNKIKTIDAFIYRFIKLQDFMGDKLFKDLLTSLGEYKDNMSLLDVLDKLEKLEIIKSADQWFSFRAIRNKMTHEYPDNEQDVIAGLILAIDAFNIMEEILLSVKKYCR
ncbi:MAG TPA: hypothetical protein P5123_07165, partial [Spirochaetota bacterium]|nr:hypothetical protein [Spirochaetota bacterium]